MNSEENGQKGGAKNAQRCRNRNQVQIHFTAIPQKIEKQKQQANMVHVSTFRARFATAFHGKRSLKHILLLPIHNPVCAFRICWWTERLWGGILRSWRESFVT